MSSKKRTQSDADMQKRKKARITKEADVENARPVTSVMSKDEVDFPRGGGTSFTAVEYKQIRSEAMKEVKDEVFKENASSKSKSKAKSGKEKNGRKSETKSSSAGKGKGPADKSGTSRVEHLNYKRITVGMKILCQVAAIYPLALLVSLPNQLLGHVPITQITLQSTAALEAADEADASDAEVDSEEEEETSGNAASGTKGGPPDLMEVFRIGQFVRAVVTAVRPAGTTEGGSFSYARDDMERTSRRVELSLVPEQVNAGVHLADLQRGFTMSAAVKSVEDHGYILDIGTSSLVSGFLPFKKANGSKNLPVGVLLDVTAEKLSEDKRTCTFSADKQLFRVSLLKEISNVSSLLPGMVVQGLVTAVEPSGTTVQLLGSFTGTVDLFHYPNDSSSLEVGGKLKARILYEVAGTTPPHFALSLREHVVSLEQRKVATGDETVEDAYPVGTHIQVVKVKRVESDRGILVQVSDGVDGFVHISHVSDEHVPSLSGTSGLWKVGTVHQARVVGYHPFDGILQLSMRPTVLAQKFLRVDDVQVGELVKGTVRKLTGSALFVRINGNVDGMIWPTHYADIMLKNPQKRFQTESNIKCRVLAVDASRKRIQLTAKKTLVESDLPIISSMETAKVDLVTFGVVCKVLEKVVVVEFYNNIRGVIPSREASETPLASLSQSFSVGKPIKVRIIAVDSSSSRIVASVRKLSRSVETGSIEGIEVGQVAVGIVSEIVGDNVRLQLQPSNARALMSLKNVANNRKSTVDQMRTSLQKGEEMTDLVVVSRNVEKGFVLVANKPSQKHQASAALAHVDLDAISVGSRISGIVTKHTTRGTLARFPGAGNKMFGLLHPTDTSDDFEEGTAFPAVNSLVNAVVIAIDKDKRQFVLSTRPSRLAGDASSSTVKDPEVKDLKSLEVNKKIRGFIKSITDHGLFVTVGRDIDARVQIKELYNEFVKDWKKGFELNQMVEGRIMSTNEEKKQAEMTFRSGPIKKSLTFSDLSEGQKLDGRVKRVTDFGIFISIEESKVTGLCHKLEIADNAGSDVALALRNFHEGDNVRAIILKLDNVKQQISLGMKPSYFQDDDIAVENSTKKESEKSRDSEEGEDGSQANDPHEDSEEQEADDDDAMSVDEEELHQSVLQTVEVPTQRTAQLVPALTLQGGFQWGGMDNSIADEDEITSGDESDSQLERKKKKKKKTIEYDLTGEMHTKLPDSVTDFERRLLSSPNSSYLWIQYMSFQLQLSEVDKAREIGRRALKTINYREEQEKLNVWIALLNIENTFGTEDSLEKTFKESARTCDSKTIHLRLASILDQSQKLEKAEEQYKRTAKKFGKSSKVWSLFGEHYLHRGQLEEFRKLLPRCLQSLEKRKHLKTISKFAQLEYKLGDPERGKTIFEGIIDSQPKRFDLWSIYMDMEAGQKNIQSLRNLFDRVLAIKMTSHKAKAFFKKWLSLEERFGDEGGKKVVTEKAIEWTQRTASG